MPPLRLSINNKNRRRIMKTKTIFKLLAFAMLMPALLLTIACSSSDDDAVNNNNENTNKKGFTLPVTVNVTREGEATTRAEYNESTKKLAFSTGDKLFVAGSHGTAGQFAGTLNWDGGGTFSGTITTENAYDGTAEALLAAGSHAELLPADYTTYGYLSVQTNDSYNATVDHDNSKAIATSKAVAVEQFSREEAASYSSGFALSSQNTILNFTTTHLTASPTVTVKLANTSSDLVSGEVTTNGSGTATFATFAMATEGGVYNINELTLTVGGNAITFPSDNKALAAGHIYNINRCATAISGKFTVASGKQVYFSKSNLNATTSDNGTNWSWHFVNTQYARVGGKDKDGNGTSTGNNYINGNRSVTNDGNGKNIDLFGWSTAKTYLGINSSTTNTDYQNGGKTDGSDFVDWGSHADVIAGIGTGWRTLNKNEWRYLTDTRGGNMFALASINGTRGGIILLPDNWKTSYYSLSSINNASVAFTTNTISDADWSTLEAHGAVFLPVTGQRNSGNKVNGADNQLHYWSSTGGMNSATPPAPIGYHLRYMPSGDNKGLAPDTGAGRCNGFSVRLVRDVE